MHLALFQMSAVVGDVDANLERIAEAAAQASQRGASLLVAPELALGGYGVENRMRAVALAPGDAAFERLSVLAAEHGLAIIAGFAERAGEQLYNSAAFFNGRDAPFIYRKSHLYGAYEKALFVSGQPQTVLVDHDGLRVGMLICYDVEFPENVRRLAQAGADLICVPTALPAGSDGAFIARHMVPVRAFENQLFIAYSDNCGHDGKFAYQGMSVIAAPDGAALASTGSEGEALLFATIDPAAYAACRARNTYLSDL